MKTVWIAFCICPSLPDCKGKTEIEVIAGGDYNEKGIKVSQHFSKLLLCKYATSYTGMYKQTPSIDTSKCPYLVKSLIEVPGMMPGKERGET
jgi:hypothetical protein